MGISKIILRQIIKAFRVFYLISARIAAGNALTMAILIRQ